ncbi:hypothetical protein NLJ89_g6227 [Agrocybe chaxingu]|uniref:Uncharacterized protein n=1 Tax=Agrocybe chaxingu TaxID=84603 RepID=A0A9W8JZ22_9AGAR|nr:hypothetical protein NLJ89_g6227 [Agrocybe chaxingu]
MSSAKYAPVPTTAQPPATIMPQDLNSMISESEKSPRGNSSSCQHSCGHCESNGNGHPPEHRGCHNGRLRRVLLPALIAFVILSGLFALSCVRGYGADAAAWGVEALFSRQNNGAGSGSDNGVFVDRKYYLIVIFVPSRTLFAVHATFAHAAVVLLACSASDAVFVLKD